MIVVAGGAGVAVVGGGDPVTAPEEAALLSLSVHTVVVVVPMTVDSVPLAGPVVVASDADEDEVREVEIVTLCVRVVAVVVAEDEVAVYVGVHSSAGKVNVPL